MKHSALSSTQDMTTGKSAGLILRFSIPLFFGNLFQQLYSIVDAVVVGRFIGVDALASIGCVSWLCWMISALFRDTANAFSIAASVRVGNRDLKGFRDVIGTAVIACAVLGIPLTVILRAAVPFILRVLNVQPNVISMTTDYLIVFIYMIPIGLVYNIAVSLLRAYGNSSITFVSMLASTVVNIVLDLVFVLVFGWGVWGAAVATWIAQAAAMVIALAVLVRTPEFHIGREELRIHPAIVKQLLQLWWPMLFNSLIIALGGMFVEQRTNALGSSFTAGIAACMKIFSIMEAVIMALQTGTSVYVGQNLGAGKYKRIRKGLLESLKIGVLMMGVMTVLVMGTEGWILPLFLSSEDASAYERAYEVAMRNILVILPSMFVMTPMYLHRVTIQTLGFPKYAGIAGVLQMGARILTVQLGPSVWGEYAYYLHDGMAWLVSLPVVSIPCYVYLRRRMQGSAVMPIDKGM